MKEATSWHKKFDKPVIMQEYGGDTLEGLHFVSINYILNILEIFYVINFMLFID